MGAVPNPTFSTLSPAWQRLVRMTQSIRYGRLTEVGIRDGEPVFTSSTTAVRNVRLNAHQRAERRTPHPKPDFALRREVLSLMAQVSSIREGTIDRLEIADGLPQLVEVSEAIGD